MKKNILFFVVSIIAFVQCSIQKETTHDFIDYSTYSSFDLNEKKRELRIIYNYEIGVAYTEYLNRQNEVPPLGNFGWEEVKVYWSTIPELGKLHRDFEIARAELVEFKKENDFKYKIAYELFMNKQISQKEFFERTKNTTNKVSNSKPEEYRKLKHADFTTLGIRNRESLEFIVNDYKSNEKLFPVNWIPAKQLNSIKRKKRINKIATELNNVENEIFNRRNNNAA